MGVCVRLATTLIVPIAMLLGSCSSGTEETEVASSLVTEFKSDSSQQVALNGKTTLQNMADLGFEPAKRSARVNFELAALDGTNRTLEYYAGNYVLLNFWATWCAPCRIEMPALERLHQELADRGLQVIGVDIGEETELVERFIEHADITFEILIDHDMSTAKTYGAGSIPMTYIIDREGMIVARAIGVREWDSAPMKEMFAALIKNDSVR